MPNLFKALPRKRSIIALAAALAASPALATQDYPPGFVRKLARRSCWAARRNRSFWTRRCPFHLDLPPDADGSLDDYCDGLAFRIFRSLVEVRQAHARCDHVRRVAPLSPPAEDQSDE
jgi:hypothetical protein